MNEEIPNDAQLFYRIPKAHVIDGDIMWHSFTPVGDGLSTDWDKYSTAEEALTRPTPAYPNGRTRQTHGIGHFNVSHLHEIDILRVIHAPSIANRAHSLIQGFPEAKEPYIKIRKKLKEKLQYWDIEPEL